MNKRGHTDIDYEKKAKRFNADSYFNGDLGDNMPMALTSALQFTIVSFHNKCDTPAMYVSPDLVTTAVAAFLVYTSYSGLRHYDAAIPCYQLLSLPGNEKSNRCSCGINKQNAKNSCSPNKIYMTRCSCFKQNKPCTHLCHCVNCSNPNGVHTPMHAFRVDIPHSKKFTEVQ